MYLSFSYWVLLDLTEQALERAFDPPIHLDGRRYITLTDVRVLRFSAAGVRPGRMFGGTWRMEDEMVIVCPLGT